MQAWFSLPLAEITRGVGCVARQDIKNGDARPATVAVRKNWRRDHDSAAEGVDEYEET